MLSQVKAIEEKDGASEPRRARLVLLSSVLALQVAALFIPQTRPGWLVGAGRGAFDGEVISRCVCSLKILDRVLLVCGKLTSRGVGISKSGLHVFAQIAAMDNGAPYLIMPAWGWKIRDGDEPVDASSIFELVDVREAVHQ